MNQTRGFVVGMVVLVLLGFLVQINMPQPFVWTPTFRHTDPQPFGSLVFDSVMGHHLKQGYTVAGSTLEKEARSGSRRNVLYVASVYEPDSADAAAIKRMLGDGRTVMLAFAGFPWQESSVMKRELGMQVEGEMRGFDLAAACNRIVSEPRSAWRNIVWKGGEGQPRYPEAGYKVLIDLCQALVVTDDSVVRSPEFAVMATDGQPVLVERRMGRGRLIVCSLPLLLTNYGVTARATSPLVFRMMAQLSDRPVVRLEDPAVSAEERSVLSYLAAHPPLVWAWRLMLLTVLLATIQAMRRRQRVIPVAAGRPNPMLGFTQHIGSLLYERRDDSSLLRQKLMLTADSIRRRTGLDICDTRTAAHQDTCRQLSAITALPAEEIDTTLRRIRYLSEQTGRLPKGELRRLVEWLNLLAAKI